MGLTLCLIRSIVEGMKFLMIRFELGWGVLYMVHVSMHVHIIHIYILDETVSLKLLIDQE